MAKGSLARVVGSLDGSQRILRGHSPASPRSPLSSRMCAWKSRKRHNHAWRTCSPPPRPRIGDADKVTRTLPTTCVAKRLGKDVGTRAQCGLSVETTASRTSDLGQLRHSFPSVRDTRRREWAVARGTVASPSSTRSSPCFRSSAACQQERAGNPAVRITTSTETSSTATDERETHACFLERATNGIEALGPTSAIAYRMLTCGSPSSPRSPFPRISATRPHERCHPA